MGSHVDAVGKHLQFLLQLSIKESCNSSVNPMAGIAVVLVANCWMSARLISGIARKQEMSVTVSS